MAAYSLAHTGFWLVAGAGAGGIWGLLRLIVRGRNAVALEREHRATTIAILQRLPPGARIIEQDGPGRTQMIDLPQNAAACITWEVNGEVPGQPSR